MTKKAFLTIVAGIVIIWFIIGAFFFLTKPAMETTEFFSLGMEICYACEDE